MTQLPVQLLTDGKSHYVASRWNSPRYTSSVCGCISILDGQVCRVRGTTSVARVLSLRLPTCRRCLRLALRVPTRVAVESPEAAA